MNPIFRVNKCENNGIVIVGESQCVAGYQPETSKIASYERYRYSDCYTFNIVMYEEKGEESLYKTAISCHNTSIDESRITLSKDGIYNVHHIIIPSIDWLEDKLINDLDFLDGYKGIYVTDGEYIYKFKDDKYTICKPEEIVEVNPYKTTLFRASMSIFSIYHLYECYINMCITLLNDPNACTCARGTDSEMIFKRDFVWMAINVIEYYIERDQLYAAEEVLNEINSCGGFCQGTLNPVKSGCGCGKH